MQTASITCVKKSSCLIIYAALLLCVSTFPVRAQETILDKYVAKKDPAYSWKLVKTIAGESCTGYVLELHSQTWRSDKEVDRAVWTHWLTVVKPKSTTSNKALLFIGGGDNGNAAPAAISERAKRFAIETNTVIAELGMVPNQPLFF
jgi:PhoPQ-activated pathogenicity-related protein